MTGQETPALNDQAEQPEQPKKRRRFSAGHIIALILCILAGTAALIVLNNIRFLVVFLMLFGIWGFGQSKTGIRIFATVIVTYFGIGMAPMHINSNSLWKYPYQRTYIGIYNTTPEWFPDFKDDVKGEFEFDYMPSVMQGTGHYAVYFETDSETAERYTRIFSEKAAYSFSYYDYIDGAIYEGSIPQLDIMENHTNGISFYLGDKYSDKEVPETDVYIYVLEANLNSNHPRTSAVFIDKDKNTILLSQLG